MSALPAWPSDISRLAWPTAPLRADGRDPVARTRAARGPLLLVAAASLALHGLVLSGVVVAERGASEKPSHEIAVEIVQEVPKAEIARPEIAKPADVARPPVPNRDAAKPAPPPPVAAKPAVLSQQEAQLAELQKQLAALKAEHDALTQAAQTPRVGSGPLDGFNAAALPGVGDDGDAEAASYEALVFSQLAKAKGIGRQQGKPGTAGVRFEVDDEGKLVSADVVSPSGIASLDAEALDVVRRASPFLPPPKGAQRVFMANFNFVPQAGP